MSKCLGPRRLKSSLSYQGFHTSSIGALLKNNATVSYANLLDVSIKSPQILDTQINNTLNNFNASFCDVLNNLSKYFFENFSFTDKRSFFYEKIFSENFYTDDVSLTNIAKNVYQTYSFSDTVHTVFQANRDIHELKYFKDNCSILSAKLISSNYHFDDVLIKTLDVKQNDFINAQLSIQDYLNLKIYNHSYEVLYNTDTQFLNVNKLLQLTYNLEDFVKKNNYLFKLNEQPAFDQKYIRINSFYQEDMSSHDDTFSILVNQRYADNQYFNDVQFKNLESKQSIINNIVDQHAVNVFSYKSDEFSTASYAAISFANDVIRDNQLLYDQVLKAFVTNIKTDVSNIEDDASIHHNNMIFENHLTWDDPSSMWDGSYFWNSFELKDNVFVFLNNTLVLQV